jgi:hypothetical protein
MQTRRQNEVRVTTTTPTATDTDRELAAALDEARAELRATTKRAAEHRGRIQQLRAHLDHRAVDSPDEFGPTGEPKKGTNAGKLAAEIAALRPTTSPGSSGAGAAGR